MTPYAEGERWMLYAGDALDVLPELTASRFAAIVTDPPYASAGGNTNGRESGADTQFWRHWFGSVWRNCEEVLNPDGCGFVFSDWRMINALAAAVSGGIDRGQRARSWQMSQALVWDRRNIGLGAPFRAGFEMIGFVRGPTWKHDETLIPRNLPAVIAHPFAYGSHPNHGAEKPVDLLAKLIGFSSRAGDGLLDPFAGSGSTGVAAIQMGRRFTGIEREPGYLAVAARRLADAAAGGTQLRLGDTA